MLTPRNHSSPFDKTVGSSSDDNPDTQPPIFSFEKMVDKSGFSVNCCDKDHRAALAKKLFTLSKMVWRDIRQAPRKGLGSEVIARNSLKASIPEDTPEDADILAIRFKGQAPMLGYKVDRTFYILLLDHKFKAYNHG